MTMTVLKHGAPLARRGSAAALVAAAALSAGLGAPATSAAPVPRGAGSAATPGTLAQQWVTALRAADQQLPQIQRKLQSLPATATDAQVQHDVAPVAGILGPIEALMSLPNPKTATLEALGEPSEGVGVPAAQQPCGGDRRGYGYKSAAKGAHLQMGGRAYARGFQVSTNANCGGTYAWAWHVGRSYHTFSALVGLDSTNSTSAPLDFVAPDGTALSFSADGQPVTSVTLIAGVPTNITVNLAGNTNLIFRLAPPVGGATVDFAEDQLTA